jgi:NAD(P)-dependent dehydrogenase (short-subunit alcohol dehydrogenase family)
MFPPSIGSQWSQFYPPRPTFSESDFGTQAGRVFIITGGYSGIGFELAKILYGLRGRVYIAGRSEEKGKQAIASIKSAIPNGGSLEFLVLHLEDLESIKASVNEFKEKETRLDVLWNNAGVSQPPLDSTSDQGIELQLATNCIGPFLFTSLLVPLLEETAKNSSQSPRVVWTCSQIMELSAPLQGIIMAEIHNPPKDRTRNYINSKTGNWFLAAEFARRIGKGSSIISVAHNPGASNTNLFRHTPSMRYLAWPLLHKPELGALTELYAGLSADVPLNDKATYVLPWGRISTKMRRDLVSATQPKELGGSGVAGEFWDFCSEATQKYL